MYRPQPARQLCADRSVDGHVQTDCALRRNYTDYDGSRQWTEYDHEWYATVWQAYGCHGANPMAGGKKTKKKPNKWTLNWP